MRPPTQKELKWIARVEKLLMNPPTDRIGLFTIGDRGMTVYDRTNEDNFDYGQDFCVSVDENEAELGYINSAVNIHATAG